MLEVTALGFVALIAAVIDGKAVNHCLERLWHEMLGLSVVATGKPETVT